ncbi:MAG TPA: DUF86 domain-containing protein, partial [bacterium]|nr:DUF86 domain-containing protein [bacterium]
STSCSFILQVTDDKSPADYEADDVLRAAVERHFEIIGEAMNRIARYDSEIAMRITDYDRIISFRNVLIHGYDLVDDQAVWSVIRENVPELKKQVQELLKLVD